jgi:starvation-inducible DNA-binding protein
MMNTGMSEENRRVVSEGLDKLLADVYAIYLKTQNFHWNVTGPEFYSLHLLFEKQYEELAEYVDEIAERVRALGYYVEATFSAFKKNTRISEEDKVLNASEMVHQLMLGHESIAKEIRRISHLAEKENDAGTVDLLGKLCRDHEKFAWMLRSQL